MVLPYVKSSRLRCRNFWGKNLLNAGSVVVTQSPADPENQNAPQKFHLLGRENLARNHYELLKTLQDIFGNILTLNAHGGSMSSRPTEISVGEEKSAAATSVRLRVRRETLKLAVRRSPSLRRRRPSLDTSSSLHATPSSTHSAADKRECQHSVSATWQQLIRE